MNVGFHMELCMLHELHLESAGQERNGMTFRVSDCIYFTKYVAWVPCLSLLNVLAEVAFVTFSHLM